MESPVTDVMRRKLLRRMQQQKTLLSQKDGRAMWEKIFPAPEIASHCEP